MEIEKHLAELAQADPQARRTALENVLAAEGLTPEIQECEADERRKAARNYLLYTADKDAKGPLFCAHYDAHPGSTGANDNAAAVCILIALAKEGRARYQEQYGPLTQTAVTEGGYKWLNDPWPWDEGGSD